MRRRLQYQAEVFAMRRLKDKKRQRIVIILAAIVVFCTTYALILPAITSEANPICGLEEHQHIESCYESTENQVPICGIEEHLHDEIQCFETEEILVETAEEWEATLPADLSGTPLEKLLAVAKSQLDYKESDTVTRTNDDGLVQGATRYGIWRENPYGNWDAMFVSFCLHYAGIAEEYAPRNDSSSEMQRAYEEAGLYQQAGLEYIPKEGDIVFLETTGDNHADRVGIITKATLREEKTLVSIDVIEGDTPNQKVEIIAYTPEESNILGYGLVNTDAIEDVMVGLEEQQENGDSTEKNTEDQQTEQFEEQQSEEQEVQDEEQGEEPEEQENESQLPMFFATAPRAGANVLGQSISYTNSFSTNDTYIFYMQASDGRYYAMNNQGNAVEVFVSETGQVTTNAAAGSLDALKWKVSGGSGEWLILNVSDNRRVYPSGYSTAVTHASSDDKTASRLEEAGTNSRGERGLKIRSLYGSRYAQLKSDNSKFESIENASSNNVFFLARATKPAQTYNVWLDGSNGGLMSLGGARNERRAVNEGAAFILPTAWDSPSKYDYTLRGWYDVKNGKYYAPGSEVTITEDLVFYADWRATSYDVGVYNVDVADTVSTKDFITTKVFDYGVLFNVMSTDATNVNISDSSHSETWTLRNSGKVKYDNAATLNYIFRDWDGNGRISYPSSTNDQNTSHDDVTSGLHYKELEEILFNTDNSYNPETGEGIIGKEYLGTGDHLFQLMTDPNSEHYGYYYYDSSLNAASYNQKDERFYVYEYLARTSDSANSSGTGVGKYSDFVPLNSPYVNTNGKDVITYKYDGVNSEYVRRDHYTYDAKYNGSGSATNHVATNFWFGMRTDVNFYLPEAPGTRDASGNYGNQDVYGKDMHFQFSGDDDVWILIDGNLVLDIGGIHGVQSGDINFATGVVTVDGKQTGSVSGIDSGEHVLTILYLERGSSQSNCAIYFNLAPRFGLNLQKEDVLTQEALNGAQFTFYRDEACTIPAELWTSKESHNNGDPAISTVTVEKGKATIWGFGAGNTYYIKETKPPDADEYSRPNGIICLSLDKRGVASYSVKIIDEAEQAVSQGFTVHGFRIDEETQQAYIVATNAPEWVEETTSIEVTKKWADNKNHEGEVVTVYLTVTDSDGTVRRLREIQLSEENDWKYVWTNMPKYAEDGVTPIQYGVEEGYTEGYHGTIRRVETVDLKNTHWQDATSLEAGKTYLLKTSSGYLASKGSSINQFEWLDEEEAKSSNLAIWAVSSVNGGMKLTNGAGQSMTYNHSAWSSSNRYIYPMAGTSNNQTIVISEVNGGVRLSYKNGSQYYFTGIKSDGRGSVGTSTGSALTFNPKVMVEESTSVAVENFVYEVTNTPLKDETSLKVYKSWNLGITEATKAIYEQEKVTMKLLANGKDTGRTVTLSLKNNWQDTFRGLPYTDEAGNVIAYTVEESWNTQDWIPSYGEVKIIPGNPDTYEVTVINDYRWGFVHELPATGGTGTYLYTIGGLIMILFAGFGLLYRYQYSMKERRLSK
ncbi:MAG: Cna B-type domain-containing protein [Firmicutes bacterium]|nr:Cna B-type domain-containing protein [Bacillota bacterium]